MKELRAIYAIWLLDMKRLWLDRITLLFSLVQPILYLFVLGSGLNRATTLGSAGGGNGYTQFIFPGVIGLSILFSTIFSGISIVIEREFGFLKEVLVAPVSRRAIVLGKVLSGTSRGLIQGVLVLALAPIAGIKISIVSFVSILLVMVVVGLSMSSLGVLIASRFRSSSVFPIVINSVLLPLFFLSGALYPINNLPGWLSPLVNLNPVTYAIGALRSAALPKGLEVSPGVFIAVSSHSFLVSVLVVAIFGLIMGILAIWSFSKAE